jgi:DNA-binding MarR family transcriptional regulator
LTRRKEVSPSRHSPSCWIRWATATRRFVARDAVAGQAQLGGLDQVADDGGVVVGCHLVCFFRGVYNVDTLGHEERVAVEEARAQDRRRALLIAGLGRVGIAVRSSRRTSRRVRAMHGSDVAVGSTTRSGSWAELLRSILERDRDTLGLPVQLERTLPGSTVRQLLAPYLLVEAPGRVGALAGERNVTTSSASGLVAARLVERKLGTTDRRLVVCLLTGQGRREPERFLQLGRLGLEWVLSRRWAADLLVVHWALSLLVAAAREVVAEQRGT